MSKTGQGRCLSNEPLVSVIVCTRNRKANAAPTVRALLASDYENFEILVMDQSGDDSTDVSLRPLCAEDKRLHYHHIEDLGKPHALNQARDAARGEYLVLTDDDCEPEPSCLSRLVAAFQSDPAIGCVFGSVSAPDHDKNKLYVPVCPLPRSFTISSPREYVQQAGMDNVGLGANMALRADVARSLEGWDPCPGPGARFASGDDYNMAMRVLLRGYSLHFCSEANVAHYGYRELAYFGRDAVRWGFGSGATFAKFLRLGVICRHPLNNFLSYTFACFKTILRWQRPFGTAFPKGWLQGFFAGLVHPIDRRLRSFRPDTRSNEARAKNGGIPHSAHVILRVHQSGPQHAGPESGGQSSRPR